MVENLHQQGRALRQAAADTLIKASYKTLIEQESLEPDQDGSATRGTNRL